MPGLILTLLGGFGARRAGEGPITIVRRKPEALLAYLACVPGRIHPRDKLATLLWPDVSDRTARHSLRQALVTLRQALPADVLDADEATVGLHADAIEVDVAVFERLVADGTRSSLERAAPLYRGDFLAGLAVKAAPFEEWMLAERERLRELALQAFARLLAHQRDANDLPTALQTALQLVALDPLQEPVHRTVMRLQAALGRRDAALRQYQTCVDVLQRQLGIEPEAETKALYREILRHRGRPSPLVEARAPAHPAPAPPRDRGLESLTAATAIIGREPELTQLRLALDASSPPRGRLIAVLGEAGIGKSRLLAEFASRALGGGARVLLGRSYQSAMIMPFGPWTDALRGGDVLGEATEGLDPVWRRELARLFPELAEPGRESVERVEDAGRLFEGFARLFEHLAARQPLVVMLEDVHWADGMTVRLLSSLARRPSATPIVFVASVRDDELTEAPILRGVLDELGADGRLDRVLLTPLSRPETVELVRGLARAGSDEAAIAPLASRLWEFSHGNPFMVVETMAALEQGSPLVPARGLALPERVRDVIARRLDRLSPIGRSLVAVAAVIGREFEFPLLRQASMLEEGEVAEGLEELVRRRVLGVSHERFDFTHDRIREVATAELLPPRRRMLHRQVAEALESLAPDALDRDWSALGAHCREAGLWEKAARYFRAAGEKASARLAHRDGAACLDQAADALRRVPQSRETLEQTVDLHFELRNVLLLIGDLPRLGVCVAAAEKAARELDDPRRLAWASLYAGQYRWWTDESGDARVFAEEAETRAESLDDASLRITTPVVTGFAWYNAGDYRRGERSLARALTLLEGQALQRRHGHHSFPSPAAHSHMTRCLAELGEFAEGIRHGHEALRAADTSGHKYRTLMSCWTLGDLYRIKGELDEAIGMLERAVAVVRDRFLSPQVVASLGHAYALGGRVDEGLALLEQGRMSMKSVGWNMFRSRLLEHLGRAYLLAGRLDEARSCAGEALEVARDRRERGFEAWALRLCGDVEARSASQAVEPAGQRYQLALTLSDELGMRPLAAHCHFGLGRLLQRAGTSAAEDHLRIATSMYRELGMRA